LGEAYYQKHKDEESCEESEQFFLIREALEEIDNMKEELLKRQGSVACPKCGATMPEYATFCSSCGSRMNDIYEEE
jgi:ribosomal protein L40E